MVYGRGDGATALAGEGVVKALYAYASTRNSPAVRHACILGEGCALLSLLPLPSPACTKCRQGTPNKASVPTRHQFKQKAEYKTHARLQTSGMTMMRPAWFVHMRACVRACARRSCGGHVPANRHRRQRG